MGVSEPKKRLTKEQIIEILRRNARLFKNEPEFIAYIVDLAMYLLENFLDQEPKEGAPAAPFKASPKDVKDVYRVFERFSSGQTPTRECPMCGCPVESKRKCPNCDAMTF